MKQSRLFFILLLSLLATAAIAQNKAINIYHDSTSLDSIRQDIANYTLLKDSLLKLNRPKQAYMAIVKADSLREVLRDLIFSLQEQSFILSQELSKKRELEKSMQWQNDSLMLIQQIAEKDKNKALLQSEISSKEIKALEKKRKLRLLEKSNAITQFRNKHNSEKIAEEKRQVEEEFKIMITTIIIFLLFIGVIYLYIKWKTYYAHRLTIKMQESQNAKDAAVAAKDEYDKARMEAEKAATMKSVFIHNMSHEIRTPLNAIVGFSNVLIDKTMEIDNDSKQEFSTLIAKNSDLLTTLINDILDLSDLISGQYKMKYQQTTVHDICTTAYNTVKHRTPDGVEMKFVLPEKVENLEIWTDGGRVEQVLINYFTNACKYTTEGSIGLTYNILRDADTQKPSRVRFTVTDTGSGIPAEKAESVFKRFEKLDDFKQGNGLGLNICRTIAERLGAKCWLDTSYTTGCRFCLDIPVHITQQQVDEFLGKQEAEQKQQTEVK